jgi:hypothetical protein
MKSQPNLNEADSSALAQRTSKLNEELSKLDKKLAFIELGAEAPEEDENDTSFIRAQKRRARGLESEFKCAQC